MLLFHHHNRFMWFIDDFYLIDFKLGSVLFVFSSCWDLRAFTISELLVLINLIETGFKLIFQLNADIFLSCIFLFMKSQLIDGLLVSFIQFLQFYFDWIVTGTFLTSIGLLINLKTVISALLNVIKIVLLKFEPKNERTID